MSELTRDEVERIAHHIDSGAAGEFVPMRPDHLRALCRAWLALHDAVEVSWLKVSPTVVEAALQAGYYGGHTVKVVRWPITPVEGGGDG